jgi:hypothetical protein
MKTLETLEKGGKNPGKFRYGYFILFMEPSALNSGEDDRLTDEEYDVLGNLELLQTLVNPATLSSMSMST